MAMEHMIHKLVRRCSVNLNDFHIFSKDRRWHFPLLPPRALRPKGFRPMNEDDDMLQGKIAVITGSTSGIGLGIARALATQSCTVVLNGRHVGEAEEKLRTDLAKETGAKVRLYKADMSQPTAIYTMVEEITGDLGGIDILVNNAGIQHVAPLTEFPNEMWDQVLATNLSAAFHTTKAVLPGMKARKWGRIVNIASAHGLVASPFKAAYVAAKHGMVGLTKVTALETAEEGITCNAICPGYVWTPMVAKQIDDQAKSHGIPQEAVIRDVILAPQPTKRFINVEELGTLTVFLCSDAAISITGTALPVEGGWVAR
jgi:3-hydroxybutyrate dehydrogenase